MTPKTLPAILFALSLTPVFVGCALLGGFQDEARTSAAYTLTIYNKAWQPALHAYAKLDYCGSPAVPPCRDRALYRKLYDLDAAVAACAPAAIAALKSDLDLSLVPDCVAKVEEAKAAFAKGGLVK